MRKRQKIPCSPSNRRITQDQRGLNRRNSRLRAGTKAKMEMDRTAEEAECLETVQMGPAADSHQETNVTRSPPRYQLSQADPSPFIIRAVQC